MENYKYNNELAGKIALVTGGTKGAGRAIAERLAQAGAKVIVTARNHPEKINDAFTFIAADLSTVVGTNQVIEDIKSAFGSIDILINNMGGSETPGGGFSVLTDDHWEETLQTNFLAPVRLDRGLLPLMLKKASGCIIHIASIQGKLPLYDSTLPYAAAKAALINYSKGLSNELASQGDSRVGWIPRFPKSVLPYRDGVCHRRRYTTNNLISTVKTYNYGNQ